MPSRNITVPVSDWSPEAIGRTREPETRERAGSVRVPSGQNLAGKQQDHLCPRQLSDILARHSNGRLCRRLWKSSFIGLGPGFGDVGLKTQNESISMHRFAASG
jgi:hypothetical protein